MHFKPTKLAIEPKIIIFKAGSPWNDSNSSLQREIDDVLKGGKYQVYSFNVFLRHLLLMTRPNSLRIRLGLDLTMKIEYLKFIELD